MEHSKTSRRRTVAAPESPMKGIISCAIVGLLLFGASPLIAHMVYFIKDTPEYENGKQACEEEAPKWEYCLPIHAGGIGKDHALVIEYSEIPEDWELLQGQTGFAMAHNKGSLSTKITVALGEIRDHTIYPQITIYEGILGENKVGLVCYSDGCKPWL